VNSNSSNKASYLIRNEIPKRESAMKNELLTVYSLLNYLVKQPAAKDTMQGIGEWWILKEQVSSGVERIGIVLESLVERGFVIVKEYQGQEKYYQINMDRISEIEEFLKKIEATEPLTVVESQYVKTILGDDNHKKSAS